MEHTFTDKQTPIQELKHLLTTFRDERDWLQFHDPKNLSEALSIEAAELLELFLWKTPEDIEQLIAQDPKYKERIEEELADVCNYCLQIAAVLNIDMAKAIQSKVKKNEQKYPVETSKGTARKYTSI